MYGQYGQCGLFEGNGGDSGSLGSLSSITKKKRVPLLGKTRRTTPPIPILPMLTALKHMAETERTGNTYADDVSLMSMPSDQSHDGDDGTTAEKNGFLINSDESNMDPESQLSSNIGLQHNLEVTDSSRVQKTQIFHEHNHFNHHQVWSEEPQNMVPESRAVEHSEAFQINKYINNPDKGCLGSGKVVSTHSNYPSTNCLSTNPQKATVVNSYNSGNSQYTSLGQNAKAVELVHEKVHAYVIKPDKDFLPSQNIDPAYSKHPHGSSLSTNPQHELFVNNYDSSNNVDTLLGQKAKTVEPFHGEIHNSATLCTKEKDEGFHMGPPLMCSSAKANKGIVLRNIINHKEILNSKMKSVDVRRIPKIIQASDENLQQTDLNYVMNKENELGVFASKTAAFNITPAKYNKSSDTTPVGLFGSIPLNSSKERGFQIPARKGNIVEKQLDDQVESYAPFCNINMMQNTPLLDNIQHVKRKIEEDDKISELNSVGLSTNKENYFHSCARKYFTPVSKKEQSSLYTQGTNLVEKIVTPHEGLKIQQPVQSKAGSELVYKQDQDIALKLVQKQDNYITVNGKDYKAQKILGRGGSSQVFEVLDPSTMQELAVKCVDLSVADPSIAQGYLDEIALLRRLQGSETVICMIDFEYQKEKQMLYVVLEKGEFDLSKLMKIISKSNQIPIIKIIYYWVEMLTAVKNIHANGIIHSDLKPANFIFVSGCMKLIDFGIASSVQSDMTSVFKDAPAGTFNYVSPEAIQATHSTSGNQSGYKISYKSDIWSLGCILYNLLYGKTPFQHIVQPWAKAAAIADPGHTITYPNTRSDCPPVLLKAVKLCLTYDPKKRPTAAELLELPYINYQ